MYWQVNKSKQQTNAIEYISSYQSLSLSLCLSRHSSATCPADAFLASGSVCRASAGPCDVVETCSGSSSSCPIDAFAASSVQCRASAGLCDVAEQCSGMSRVCVD
jgi:hypothetical protein